MCLDFELYCTNREVFYLWIVTLRSEHGGTGRGGLRHCGVRCLEICVRVTRIRIVESHSAPCRDYAQQ